jgi:hypothetical protein
MSWRFPDKRPTNTGVMGVEDANDAALPVVEEASGRLSEMNWAENSFTTTPAKARFSKDMAYRHFRKHAFISDPSQPTSDADYYDIPFDSTWHVPVDSSGNTLSHTFNSVGGNLYICARSFLQVFPSNGAAIPMLMAVKVNGALIPESVCGNLDISEYTLLESTGMQYGFNAVSEITVPITPGRAVVEVVVRVRFDSTTGGNFRCGVGTRSLILWEMAR